MDRKLEAFLAVANARTLTEAASDLGLTQPTLTKRIDSLEDVLGIPLFERDRRGARLTEAGQVYLNYASRIAAEFNKVNEEIKGISAAGFSTLRIGAGPLYHLTCAADLLAQLTFNFPEMNIELITQTNYDSGRMLLDREIDVYLGIIPPEQYDESFYFRPLTSIEHGLILRADSPFADKEKISPEDIKEYPWVSFSTDPVTEKAFLNYTIPKGATETRVDIRTTSFATGLQLVQTGKFVMSAPLQLARIIEAEGLVIRPSSAGMEKRVSGLYLRNSSLRFAAIKSIMQFFEKLGPNYFEQ